MIEELRAGQVVEFGAADVTPGALKHGDVLKRYMVIDVRKESEIVLVGDHDPRLEVFPLAIVKRNMVVVQEPSPPAKQPEEMTKDDVFDAVFDFMNHQQECDDCAGEIDGGTVGERYRYLCDEAKKLLAWFVQRS
mgnify:CR=1 FL=1